MADETYNGWRNRETERVQLYLTHVQNAGTVAQVAGTFTDHPDGQHELEKWLRVFVTTRVIPDPEWREDVWGQFAEETLEAALGRVDWDGLAVYWSTVGLQETEAGS